MISIRIPFAQIRQLPSSGQLSLCGTVINVISDVERAQVALPRFCDTESIVFVGIKRKMAFAHTYMAGMVRPLLTVCALKSLLQSTVYKDNCVRLNLAWHTHTEALQRAQLPIVASPHCEEELEDEALSDYMLHNFATSQQMVDLNDSIYHIAPSEGFQPLSVFKDTWCEELSFPTLFYGEKRKYHAKAVNDYQTVVKWELCHSDRRFALNIENIFFKAMKIMLLKVLSSIWVRLRKGKAGTLSLTAGVVS